MANSRNKTAKKLLGTGMAKKTANTMSSRAARIKAAEDEAMGISPKKKKAKK